MPQPRIHISDEARRVANCKKSRKHYEVNKEAINAMRRAQYNAKKGEKKTPQQVSCYRRGGPIGTNDMAGSSTPSKVAEKNDATQYPTAEEQKESEMRIWNERATRIHKRFLRYLDGSAVQFLHKASREYLQQRTSMPFLERSDMLGEFQLSLIRCHDGILQIYGVGDQLTVINSMIQDVKKVLNWLEEVACVALVDYSEVRKSYHRGEFEFQKQK
ncbi:hypothetical protein BJ165DRAFT_1530098 [Panaeolus papilionaceus]|nr:hypothetical protein BJ165DRAFT_1530098 [Panaeolus papilionaceus]